MVGLRRDLYFKISILNILHLLSRDDGSIGDQGEVDPGVGDQVGLELVQVHVESSVKPQGSRDGGDNLADQPVEVGVGRSLDVEVPPADVVDSLVVDHEGTVNMLERGVSGEDRVVGFHYC